MINPKTIKQQIKDLRDDLQNKASLVDVVDNEDGTFSLWLEKGTRKLETKIVLPQGEDGKSIVGDSGRSAFEIAQEYGFEGTEKEWLDSLKGENGKTLTKTERVVERIVEKLVKAPDPIVVKGKDGKNGKNGKDGAAGSRWYSGITTPSNSMGKQYDYYLHLGTGDVYEKGKTTWLKKGNIKGPAGHGGGGAFFSRGGIDSIQAGTNITIDNTNPQSPIINAAGGTAPVDSVNGYTGIVVLSKSDIGLGNADNTSDANKPVSTAQATANTADRARANHTGSQAASTISDFSEAVDDRVDTFIQDSAASTPKISWVYDDTANTLTPVVKQSYDVFIYNSSLTKAQCIARGGNVHNLWGADPDGEDRYLMFAIAAQAGTKTVIFEQDESIPTGAWNLDYTELKGNGNEYNAGGFTVTWPTGCTISSWLGGVKYNSLRMRNTSTLASTFTTSVIMSLTEDTTSNIDETNYPFISSSYAGQNIIALIRSSRFQLIGGSVIEHIDFTAGAFAQTIILSRGDGAVVNNNTLKSTNAQVFLDIVGSVNQTLPAWPSTHSALNIGFELDLMLTDARALLNTAAGNIASTTVQGAINELDTEKVAKAGDTMTGGLVLAAGTTTLQPLKWQSGTLLTTPVSGVMEYDGNALYFTLAGIRRYITLGNDIRVTDTTVTNTTTETTIHTSPIAANELKVGKMYRVTLLGKTTTTNASQFFTLRFKMGSATLITVPMAAKAVTDDHFKTVCHITIRTIGASGSYAAHVEGTIGDQVITITPVTGSVDTTAAENMVTTLQWDAANAGNVFTIMQSVLEVIG